MDCCCFALGVFEDDRGSFSETWNQQAFDEATGEAVQFVQANESVPKPACCADLHFQAPPHAQGKLVRVVRGRVLDVAVDLRSRKSHLRTAPRCVADRENRWQFYVPPGFAHGFLALEDDTVFQYLCTALYHRESEQALLWNDPDLGIDWGVDQPLVSPKDAKAQVLRA